MKVCYDTEFLEDGKTIELISIGLVTEDNREYYAVNSEAPWERIYEHEWLMRNVWPSLPLRDYDPVVFDPTRRTIFGLDPSGRGEIDVTATAVKPRQVIANEVRDFLQSVPDLELWGWYSASDFVALYQLWGRLMQIPPGIPMFTHDLRQEVNRLGNPEMPKQGEGLHNALADAKHLRVMSEYLEGFTGGNPE